MIAVVDCNNFYVSCERLFQPKLEHKPVIVLSNNDGCAIARSEEAKAIGIKMGTPEFMINKAIKDQVVKFSSNYPLYGDISSRVMQTLASFVPQIEVYSIDEAFLDMSGLELVGILATGIKIRQTVKKNIGIPVSVGIAGTKTLAKMANRYAKKTNKDVGVFYASTKELCDEMLQNTRVEDIWGIGKQYSAKLLQHGFRSAFDLKNAPKEWVRKSLTVEGQRLLDELNGIPTRQWQLVPKPKKIICTSRSFRKFITDKAIIKNAVCNYTASCALKLRQQKLCTKSIAVFIMTNPHKSDEQQYARSIIVQLDSPSNDTPTLIKHALIGFEALFKQGFKYIKCGIEVHNLIPEGQAQINLFMGAANKRNDLISKTLDEVNKSLGKDLVKFAAQGSDIAYKIRADYLSRRYTTNISEILEVSL